MGYRVSEERISAATRYGQRPAQRNVHVPRGRRRPRPAQTSRIQGATRDPRAASNGSRGGGLLRVRATPRRAIQGVATAGCELPAAPGPAAPGPAGEATPRGAVVAGGPYPPNAA